MPECDGCGRETELLYGGEDGNRYCEPCATAQGIISRPD